MISNNCAWLIAVAPKHDGATEDSQIWCNEALNSIEVNSDIDVKITRIFNSDAIRYNTELEINRKPKAKWFIHYGHGNRNNIFGNDGNFIINNTNLRKLKGMHVYCCNCSSGAGLGPRAIDEGIVEYWGYLDEIGWTTISRSRFGDVVNHGIKMAFIEKKTLKDVIEDTREYGYRVADQLENEGYLFEHGLMIQAMNNLRVYSREDVNFPLQRCEIVQLLRRIFNFFYRMRITN